jgi:hypothetical protein
MNLDRSAWIGIGCGVLIGSLAAALQIRDLRRKSVETQSPGVGSLVPGAVARQVFVVVAWWVAFRFTEADKYWLTGALVVTYTAPLLVQLKEFIFPKK